MRSFGLLVAILACGCHSGGGKYPPRPEGCDVRIYGEAPTARVENIGTVSARCGDEVSKTDCLRTLKDEACKLGADAIWGVDEAQLQDGARKKVSGRAVHLRSAAD